MTSRTSEASMLAYRKSTLHAIAAVNVLARAYHTAQPRVTSALLARLGGIARPSIAKDLISLERHGLVNALPGRGGGYQLARPPEQIRLTDVLRACGEKIDHVNCLLGDQSCACPLRQRMQMLRQSIFAIADQCSLRDHCDHLART